MVKKWKRCECCDKLHEIELPGKPGLHRKRGKDGLYHEFIRHMPARERWQTEKIYCIICNTTHLLYKGPVTGKLYSNQCERT